MKLGVAHFIVFLRVFNEMESFRPPAISFLGWGNINFIDVIVVDVIVLFSIGFYNNFIIWRRHNIPIMKLGNVIGNEDVPISLSSQGFSMKLSIAHFIVLLMVFDEISFPNFIIHFIYEISLM